MELREIAEVVSSLKPGEEVRCDLSVLRNVQPLEYNGARWSPSERVLENVIGSAYGWTVFDDFVRGQVTFGRRTVPDGARTYVAPDRRDRFDLRPDGFYWLKPEPAS